MKRAPLLAIAVAALAVAYAAAGHAAATVSVPKCPSHAPAFTSGTGTDKTFVRHDARVVRLCRYYKVNWADSQGLWRQRLIGDGRTISQLTTAFNKLQPPPRGIFCVKDDKSEMLLLFGYAGAKPERVVVKLSGCRFTTNGNSTRSTTAALHRRLLALSNSKP
jgi:hypothetical protein